MIHNETTCKICRCAVTVKVHPDCPPLQLDSWLNIAACNRCADFYERIYKCVDLCDAAVVEVIRAKQLRAKNEATVVQFNRELLAKYTKNLVRITADQFHYPSPHWEMTVVDMMIDAPDKVWQIIHGYVNMVKREMDNAKKAALPKFEEVAA